MQPARVVRGAAALSAAGLISIAVWEGFQPEAYIPTNGDVPTIGFGHTANVQLGDVVTVPEALSLLREDIRAAEQGVLSCVRVPLAQEELDVFTSLAFNIGTSAFCGSTLVRKLNDGDRVGACEEIKRWVYVGKAEIQGLVRRRASEYERCMKAVQ